MNSTNNKNFEVNIWQISGYIKVDKFLRDLIRKEIKNKYGSLHRFEKLSGLSDYHHRKLHEKYTRIDLLKKILRLVNINVEILENHVVDWKYQVYPKIKPIIRKFPIRITPLYLRLVAHVVGDGCVSRKKYQQFCWWQKSIIPLIHLQKKLFGEIPVSIHRKNRITIPKFIINLVNPILNLPPNKFDKLTFLASCLSLPRDYRIQVLTAIIEDEGAFDRNRLIIRMMDKETMILVSSLIDSLGYDRTRMRSYWYYSQYVDGRRLIYRFDLNVRAIKKYYKDLEQMKLRYGNICGLWKKNEVLEKISKNRTLMMGYDRHELLIPKIEERFLNKPQILVSEVKNYFKLTDNEAMSLFRCMKNRNLIRKSKHGVYLLNKK